MNTLRLQVNTGKKENGNGKLSNFLQPSPNEKLFAMRDIIDEHMVIHSSIQLSTIFECLLYARHCAKTL